MDRPDAYIPLPGRSLTPRWFVTGERERLWLGQDHILIVRQTSFREKSRRIYFHDLQAISVHQTPARRTHFLIYTSAMLLFVLLAASLAGGGVFNPVRAVFFALCLMFAIVCLIMLCLNWALGPTCETRLYTAVQDARVTALGRIPQTRRFLEHILPRVEAAQGARLDAAELDTLASTAHPAQHVASSAARSATPRAIRHEAGWMHAILFLLLLGSAALSFAILIYPIEFSEAAGFWVLAMLTVFNVLSIVRQRRSDLTVGVKAITWIALGYLFVMVYIMLLSMTFIMSDDAAMREVLSAEGPLDEMERIGILTTGIIEVILGLFGFIFLFASRRGVAVGEAARI